MKIAYLLMTFKNNVGWMSWNKEEFFFLSIKYNFKICHFSFLAKKMTLKSFTSDSWEKIDSKRIQKTKKIVYLYLLLPSFHILQSSCFGILKGRRKQYSPVIRQFSSRLSHSSLLSFKTNELAHNTNVH